MTADGNDIFANLDELKDPRKLLDELSAFLAQLKKAGEEKVPLAQAMNVDKRQIEQMYAMGFMAYRTKRYLDAQMMFVQLFLLDPRDDRFSFGVGSCLKARGDYKQALLMFAMAMSVNTESAKIPFYAAQSAWLDGDKDLAVQLLNETLARSSDAKGRKYLMSAKNMLDNIADGAEPPRPKPKPPEAGEGAAPDQAPNSPETPPGGRRRMRV